MENVSSPFLSSEQPVQVKTDTKLIPAHYEAGPSPPTIEVGVAPRPDVARSESIIKCLSGRARGDVSRGLAPGLVGAIALLTIGFAKSLISLGIHAARSELHSHILLVPLVTAYLFCIRREQLPKAYACSPEWVSVACCAGIAALVVAWVKSASLSSNDHLTLAVLSFLAFLIAIGFLFMGRRWMFAAAFPLFFLVFMIPMPDAMVDSLETASKLISAEAASLFFSLSGTPVMREGTIFQLPNIVIEVTQECSGIRSSWVLFITSMLVANLFLKGNWRRALLIGFVIPLGIIRNGFRVFVIGLLCVHIGPDMIHSVIHRRGGPLFFALSLVPLFLFAWWLRRGETGGRQRLPEA